MVILCILGVLYAWFLYNIPILVVGVKHLRQHSERRRVTKRVGRRALPFVSILLPVKDEEHVVSRFFRAFEQVDYPQSKKELIIVEDGSRDETKEICAKYAEVFPHCVKFVHQSVSKGKPVALNYALKFARGEVIGVFDADSVPELDALLKVARHFEDSNVAAVQGRTLSINADENFLTKIVSFEETAKFEIYLRGKDQLGLYLPLAGSCQFIRKDVLLEVGGWNEQSLAEDVQVSADMVKKGYRIKYAPEVRAWQESPGTLTEMLKQRIRWYRGWIDVAVKYGSLVQKLRRETVDAEITLMTPFILPLILLLYLTSGLCMAFTTTPLVTTLLKTTVLLNLMVLFAGGLSLWASAGRRPRLLGLLVWTYLYWGLHVLIATYSLFQSLLKRPERWYKTAKTGNVVNPSFMHAQSNAKKRVTKV